MTLEEFKAFANKIRGLILDLESDIAKSQKLLSENKCLLTLIEENIKELELKNKQIKEISE